MTLDDAHALLADPRLVIKLCDAAIAELGKGLDLLSGTEDPAAVAQKVLDKRGEARGIARVKGFFLEAMAKVNEERRVKEAMDADRREHIVPSVAAGAFLDPVKPDGQNSTE